jgi:cell division protein FtsI (penicillin-binding protein 3)
MTDPTAPVPPPDSPPVDPPPLNGGRYGRPAPRRGAAWSDAVPRMETVRVTAPDLERRRALEMTRSRLVIASGGFTVLFMAVVGKLALATIVTPMMPHRAEKQVADIVAASAPHPFMETSIPGQRAMIVDRNGQPLAISLPTVSVFADPRQIIDPTEAAHKLKSVLPRLDEEKAQTRLSSDKKFVYLERQITPREELAINNLGIPGIDFRPTQQRHYPLGRTAAQVLGGVDVDETGVAGVEAWFDKRLHDDNNALRLSLDVRVQAVVREELLAAMETFQAIGACGIVMDVNTGEVLAMVSLPDYDANQFRTTPADDRFNRAVTGMYEPGSTFKLQTASMALDDGVAHIWDEFDASRPISIGRFTITDFEGKHRWLYLPEVLAYSSNLGAAHIAQAVGAERQRAWLKAMGMFGRVGIELPEAGRPLVQPASAWKEIVTLTVGFGHGISVSPLHVVKGTAAIANGGVLLRPTILALPPGDQPEGTRVMQQSTSDVMRRLMRLVVTDGFGKTAEVPGYYPGGKTGTAEKVAAHGGYKKHANVAAFMSVFPMNAPRYAVYMMLDEPHGNKSTYGYATAGWVAAPAAGKVIARIGPMLGMLPDIVDMPAINASLAIPLQPGRPPGAFARGPQTSKNQSSASQAPAGQISPNRASPTQASPVQTGTQAAASQAAGSLIGGARKPNLTVQPTLLPPAMSRPPQRDTRQHVATQPIGASVVTVAATPFHAGR